MLIPSPHPRVAVSGIPAGRPVEGAGYSVEQVYNETVVLARESQERQHPGQEWESSMCRPSFPPRG